MNIKKTNKHIYLQLFTKDKKKVLISSSTNDKFIKKYIKIKGIKNKSNEAIEVLNENMYFKIKNFNINKILIEIKNKKYHGKIKKICDFFKKKKLT